MNLTILFARRDSIYRAFPQLDIWDADRDARLWPGGTPVIAHPPCRTWGRLRQFSTAPLVEHDLARFALAAVRRWGGILEHPAHSSLWRECSLPAPGQTDRHGGWTMCLPQLWFGHLAEKETYLYIVGPRRLPSISLSLKPPAQSITSMTRSNRERTPPEFACWLIRAASRCTRLPPQPQNFPD